MDPRDDGTDDVVVEPEPARFPGHEVAIVAIAVLAHLALALWIRRDTPAARAFLTAGVLRPERVGEEPWRLALSLLLHSGPRHVLANALSMTVFGVPLLERLGLLRTATIYAVSGVGGGLAATLLSAPGTGIVGSSGAVAGLFGAWVVLGWRLARGTAIGWRARVRTAGIGLLVLPTLLTPTTAAGHPVSVASHLGGLAAGMLTGALISVPLIRRQAAIADDLTGSILG